MHNPCDVLPLAHMRQTTAYTGICIWHQRNTRCQLPLTHSLKLTFHGPGFDTALHWRYKVNPSTASVHHNSFTRTLFQPYYTNPRFPPQIHIMNESWKYECPCLAGIESQWKKDRTMTSRVLHRRNLGSSKRPNPHGPDRPMRAHPQDDLKTEVEHLQQLNAELDEESQRALRILSREAYFVSTCMGKGSAGEIQSYELDFYMSGCDHRYGLAILTVLHGLNCILTKDPRYSITPSLDPLNQSEAIRLHEQVQSSLHTLFTTYVQNGSLFVGNNLGLPNITLQLSDSLALAANLILSTMQPRIREDTLISTVCAAKLLLFQLQKLEGTAESSRSPADEAMLQDTLQKVGKATSLALESGSSTLVGTTQSSSMTTL